MERKELPYRQGDGLDAIRSRSRAAARRTEHYANQAEMVMTGPPVAV